MEEAGGGEEDDPEGDHERADGEDPPADGTVLGGEPGGFADAKDLAGQADDHEENAESECEPRHGGMLYRNLDTFGKRGFGFFAAQAGGSCRIAA